MSNMKKDTIEAKGLSIQVYTEDFKNDYISLTDIAKYKNTDDPRFVIQNWMRNRNTLEYIGLWEILNNPNFNRVQFDTFKNEAGLNRFTMTPQKWIDLTNAMVLFLNQVDMEGLLHIKILHLSLLLGFQQNLNFIL